jgi:hypothetical protein
MKCMDLRPNFWPRTDVALSNACINSSSAVLALADGPTNKFGLEKPTVADEEQSDGTQVGRI